MSNRSVVTLRSGARFRRTYFLTGYILFGWGAVLLIFHHTLIGLALGLIFLALALTITRAGRLPRR